MMIAIVALTAGCLGSVVGVVAALKWGPANSSTTTAVAASDAVEPTPPPSSSLATSTEPVQLRVEPQAAPEPTTPDTTVALADSASALAFTEALSAQTGSNGDQAQWILQLDPEQPNTEGLTIKGSGAQTNYPLFMVRDVNNAPIAWIAPHGGLSVTDNIRVKSGVFKDDGVSMRRWTDSVAATGPGGFSWDGAELVQRTVGGAGSAAPLPDAPELWLRIMDNTGDEPRYLVIPAFLEQ